MDLMRAQWVSWPGLLLLSCRCLAGWADPYLVYSDNDEIKYPAVAADALSFSVGLQYGFGRGHIVWTEKSNRDWLTRYVVIGSDNSLSDIIDVHRDWIDEDNYVEYPSDAPTWPRVMTDPEDGMADIVFTHQRTNWYYTAFPAGSVPVREVLHAWKQSLDPPADYLEPGSHLQHISGLQRDIDSPFISRMKFYPMSSYEKIVAWSQMNPMQPSEYTVQYNYQAHKAIDARAHIEWGEICSAGTTGTPTPVSLGNHPYVATAVDKTSEDNLSRNSYLLAIVSEKDDAIVCSLLLVPGLTTAHEPWRTITLDPGSSEYSLPSCAFDYPTSSEDRPNLYLIFRKKPPLGTPCYRLYEIENAWSGTPTPTYMAEFRGSTNEARPVIKFGEDNTRYIAYIDGSNYAVNILGTGDDPVDWIGPDGLDATQEVLWIDLDVDEVSVAHGLCPQIVYLLHDTLSSPAYRVYHRHFFD